MKSFFHKFDRGASARPHIVPEVTMPVEEKAARCEDALRRYYNTLPLSLPHRWRVKDAVNVLMQEASDVEKALLFDMVKEA